MKHWRCGLAGGLTRCYDDSGREPPFRVVVHRVFSPHVSAPDGNGLLDRG